MLLLRRNNLEIFVGRKPELKKIRELLQKDKGVLLFTGESGMGKTALLEKATAEYQGQSKIIVAFHSCWHSDNNASPFIGLLADLLCRLDYKQVRSLDEHLKGIGKGLVDNAPEIGKALFVGLVETLGVKLKKPINMVFQEIENQASYPGIQKAKELLMLQPMLFAEQYLNMLNGLIKDFPDLHFLFVLDQMERPDLAAQKILLDVASNLPSRSFLIIGFKRETGTETQAKYFTISPQLNVIGEERELQGLSVEEIGDWVRQATGKDLLQPQLRAIKQASGGLPWLLDPWIKTWQATGAEADIAELREGKALDKFYIERLKSLSKEAREFAYRLSVLIDPLSMDDYCQLVGLTGGKTDTTGCQSLMKELEDHLIFGNQWWFRHEKIQSFIERQLHPENRQEYHQKAAAIFEEKLKAEKRAKFSELHSLSFHYHAGEDWKKSLSINASLANMSLKTGSLDVAEGCYLRAEEAARKLGNEEQAMANRGNLAQVYQMWGRVGEADKILKNMLQYYQVKRDKKGQSAALHNLAIIEQHRGNLDQAEGLYQESLKLLREIGDKGGIARSLHQLAMIEELRGNLDKAGGLYQDSLKLKREIGDKGGIASSLHQLGNIEYSRGSLDQAEGLYQESLKLKREIGDKGGIGNSLGQLGLMYIQREDYEQALYCLAVAANLFSEMGAPQKEQALGAIARIREKVGEEKFKEMVARLQERTGENKPPTA